MRYLLTGVRTLPFTLLFCLITVLYSSSYGQNLSITLKPNANQGKDAIIGNLPSSASANKGNHHDFAGVAWTNGGIVSNLRALIEFDFTSLPTNITIDSAQLSLYGYTSTANIGHSTRSGSNECVLQRITQSWDENIVTWNNQPNTIPQNEVTLPASTSVNQHYLNIDVTNLIVDMISDSIGNHGMMLKLKTEQHFRSLLFASSDNQDSTLHPELTIHYSMLTSLSEFTSKKQSSFNIFPNPAHSLTSIKTGLDGLKEIELLDISGKHVKSFSFTNNEFNLSLDQLSKGVYFIRLNNGNYSETKKLVKQ